GAVGRLLSAVRAMEGAGVRPAVVVLLGPDDPYAVEQITRHADAIPVIGLDLPAGEWTPDALGKSAEEQRDRLEQIARALAPTHSFRGWPTESATSLWHPYTPLRTADPPLPVVAADAEFLTLADGRRVIDGI